MKVLRYLIILFLSFLYAQPSGIDSSSIYIPDVYTPNGDGINDRWVVYTNSGDILIKSVFIYNRNGRIIYHSYQNTNVFVLQEELPEGVYTYVIVFEHKNRKIERAGSLTVFR